MTKFGVVRRGSAQIGRRSAGVRSGSRQLVDPVRENRPEHAASNPGVRRRFGRRFGTRERTRRTRCETYAYDALICNVSGAHNPLVAGSSPARPTKNINDLGKCPSTLRAAGRDQSAIRESRDRLPQRQLRRSSPTERPRTVSSTKAAASRMSSSSCGAFGCMGNAPRLVDRYLPEMLNHNWS
jgi:hypothetical protein